VRFGGISKAGPIRRVVCSTRGTPIVALALFLGSLAVSVRRLHYLDHSGLFLLIGLIPLVGWIFLPFACVRDSVSDNDFEPSPKYPSPAPRQTSDPTHGTAKARRDRGRAGASPHRNRPAAGKWVTCASARSSKRVDDVFNQPPRIALAKSARRSFAHMSCISA